MINHDNPFIDYTIEFWKERGIELNRAEAREAIDNICGFFRMLAEWDAEASAENHDAKPEVEG